MANLDYAFVRSFDHDKMEFESLNNLSNHCKKMQKEIDETIPLCAETTLAIRKLQEFAFWVEEAIAVSGQRKILFAEVNE